MGLTSHRAINLEHIGLLRKESSCLFEYPQRLLFGQPSLSEKVVPEKLDIRSVHARLHIRHVELLVIGCVCRRGSHLTAS